MYQLRSIATAAVILTGCMLLFTACNTNQNKVQESISSSVILESSGSSKVQTAVSSKSEAVLNTEIQSEDERYIEITKTLIDEGTKAICWWLDDIHHSFDIPLDMEPSYLDIYYPIPEYDSIEELKQATEQIFTKEFAEQYLYFVITDLEPPRFVEHDGKLYGNDNGGWGMILGSIKDYEVTSITESEVIVIVTADSYSRDEELTFEFILVKNGSEKDDRFDGWRLNTYFDYDIKKDRYIEIAKSLVEEGKRAMGWWLDDIHDAFDIPEDTEPSYLNMYYPVPGFNSIEELKQVTEQVFTKEFAENNLYSVDSELEYPHFVEHEGKLYVNDTEGWELLVGEVYFNTTVKFITEDKLIVTFRTGKYEGDGRVQYDFTLVKTDAGEDDRFDGWRLNTYFYYTADETSE